MSLIDFKIPNFKFPKLKMKDIGDLGDLKINVEKLEKLKKRKDNYETTDYKTVKEIFIHSMENYSENIAVLEKRDHKEKYKEITYKQFCNDVISFGTGITKFLNLQNERIIIIGETSYNWYISYMSSLCGAGICVPIDKELPQNEIESLINRSKAGVVIYSSKKKDVISKVQDNTPCVKYFVEMYSDNKIEGRNVGFNYILNEGKKLVDSGDDSFMKFEINPDEFKMLIFTSGTTSQSKGVMISNTNLAYNINAVNAYVKLTPEDRLCSVLPLHHTYESTIGFLLPFACGCSVAICEGLKYIVPNLQEAKPTAMLAVPLLIESLHKKINKSIEKSGKAPIVNSMIHVTNALKNVGVDIKRKVFREILDNLGGKLRIIVSAAAPIDPKVGKWVQDMGILFLQGYGLTETAPIAAVTPDFDTRVGSAGKVVVCDEIKVKDADEKGEGEIWISGKTVMLGYYENEEATKEALVDGWFNSGDIGYLDKDNFVYITGRSKNVIVTQNGKNIFPEEMENLVNKIEGVSESMIYSVLNKDAIDENDIRIAVEVVYDKEVMKEMYNLEDETEIYNLLDKKIKEILSEYHGEKTISLKYPTPISIKV